MAEREILAGIEVGDVVLIGGELPMWAGCLLRVEETRSWGVIGNVRGPGTSVQPDADYPLRIRLENIATVFRQVGGNATRH